MKKVLSLLVAFVFLQVQSWALSGGPQYGTLNNSVSGTYAGTLVGDIGSDSLGLFQIGMPSAGLGSGTFAFFAGGGAFFGTVVALADGEKQKMSGVLKGTMIARVPTPAVGTAATVAVNTDIAALGGQFIAAIKGSSSSGGAIGIGSRIIGTAAVNVVATDPTFTLPGLTYGPTTLTVDGFQQSSAVTGQVDLSQLTQTTSSGSGS